VKLDDSIFIFNYGTMTKEIPIRFLISLLIIFYTSTLTAAGHPFSFLLKAESHYKNAIASSLNIGGKNVIDSLLNTKPDSVNLDKAYAIAWQIGLFLLEQGKHANALDIFNDMRHYLEAQTPKTNNDKKKIASVYNIIGAIYEETGLWNDALAMYMNSLQVLNAIDNK
jgi:tetratricopeptide (TPR) repeat protein